MKNNDNILNSNNLSQIIDIKYSKIPNICFSLIDKNDDREQVYSKQRKERGFDDSETWSLTDTICHYIIPRLKRFKEVNNGIPISLSEGEWNDILDQMILSFELITRDNGIRIWNEKESEQVDKGLDLFREWLLGLWW